MPSTSIHPSDFTLLPTQSGYDRWAAIYDSEENPLISLEEPLVDELIGEVRGLAVVDIGCGTGRHAIRLARAGANVEAMDFSSIMLEKAREKAGALPIRFIVHDLAHRLPFGDGQFDRVLCGLVIDHISNLVGLFGEMRRICKPQGWVVVSVMHPAMMLRGVQARFRDPQTGEEVRPESCPNQISDYVLAAARAGFTFDHVSEHVVDEKLAEKVERARKYLGWPLLFLMRLKPMVVS